MIENAAEVFLKQQGKPVPKRETPVRPQHSPKVAKVIVKAPKQDQPVVANSTDQVLTRQSQLQDSTVQSLSQTNELLEQHNVTSREITKLLNEVLTQLGEQKTEARYQELLGSVRDSLSAMQDQLTAHAENVVLVLSQSDSRHNSRAESLQQDFNRLQSAHTVLARNLSSAIESLKSKLDGLAAELESRSQYLQDRVEQLASDLSQRFELLRDENRADSEGVTKSLQELKTTQDAMHKAQLAAISSLTDAVARKMEGFSKLIDVKLANISDVFAGVAKVVISKGSQQVQCSRCKNYVVRFSTNDAGEVVCQNCSPRKSAA